MSPRTEPNRTAPAPGAVNAVRAARQWPVFEPTKRTTFWINTLLTIVALAASYGAALGQAGFAEMYLGMHGPERFVVFLIIEATAVALMMLANQTALAGDSAGGLWTLVWVVTAGAVTMQVIHAYAIGQPMAAFVYATASVLTVILWRAKTRRSLRDKLREAGMIEDPLPRYRAVRWMMRPRETFRAWYLALGAGVSDPGVAVDMAQADQTFMRSVSEAKREDRLAAKTKAPRKDRTEQTHVVPPWRKNHPGARIFGVKPWHVHEVVTAEPNRTTPEADRSGRPNPHRPATEPNRTADAKRTTEPVRSASVPNHRTEPDRVGEPNRTAPEADRRTEPDRPRRTVPNQSGSAPTRGPAKDRADLLKIIEVYPDATWDDIRLHGLNQIHLRTGIRKQRLQTLLFLKDKETGESLALVDTAVEYVLPELIKA